MSNAILVLDEMPKSCFECELCEQRDTGSFYCASTGDSDGVGDKKPDWCPLREAPERWTDTTGGDMVALGYNMALDDLGV